MEGTADRSVADLIGPKTSQLLLSLIWVSSDKDLKFGPVSDLVMMAVMLGWLRSHIASISFELKPLMYRIAADAEKFTRFATFHPIEFDGFYHFAAQVVVICFGHQRNLRLVDYCNDVLNYLAVAIHVHLTDLLALLPPGYDHRPLNVPIRQAQPLAAKAAVKARTPAQRLSARSPYKQCPPNEVIERQQHQTEPLIGRNGGGYIEWKWIRQQGKLYGPYPYWRFSCGSKRCSIYLKALAQERRQQRSS